MSDGSVSPVTTLTTPEPADAREREDTGTAPPTAEQGSHRPDHDRQQPVTCGGPRHIGAGCTQVLVARVHARGGRWTRRLGDPVLTAWQGDACLPISVAEHARRLGMTVADLRVVVRRLAGCSPKDYLLSIRLTRAKDLLAGSELSIASIARRVGYDDPAYFTRIFTRRAGLPPSEFRAQQHGGLASAGLS
ncbi:hypothetical protein GCM10020219_027610 [Nonomuraea dietziae]